MIAGATADSYGKNVDGLEELAAQADFGISAGNRSDDMDAEILSNHDSTGSDEFKELNLHQLQTEIASLEELERVHLESKSTLRISCLRSGSWRPSLAAIPPPRSPDATDELLYPSKLKRDPRDCCDCLLTYRVMDSSRCEQRRQSFH